MPVEAGHASGFDSLLHCLEWCLELGVETVTVYAFSRDNFARPKKEVDALMSLALEKFEEFLKEEGLVMQRGVRVSMWGRMELLPEDVRRAAARVVVGTAANKGVRLNVCFAYSGIEEMVHASRSVSDGLKRGSLRPEDVDSDLITRASYLKGDREPELLVRTSGETRLSDFMMLHVSRTKLVFLDVLWPDLSLWTVLAVVLDWQRSAGHASENTRERSLESQARVDSFLLEEDEKEMRAWRTALNKKGQ